MCAALFGLMAVCSTIVLPESPPGVARAGVAEHAPQVRRAVEVDVQVAGGRCRGPRHAVEGAQRIRQLPRDDARRLAQDARQLERHGDGEVAQVAVRRVLDGDVGHAGRVEAVQLGQPRPNPLAKRRVQLQDHGDRRAASCWPRA